MLIQSLTHQEPFQLPLGGRLLRNLPDPVQVKRGITRVYDFAPNEKGVMVCDVTHEADIRRLLAIREGFAPYGAEAEALATEAYGWTEYDDDDQAPRMAAGQVEIRTEYVDDDDTDDGGDAYTGEDDDDGLAPASALGGALPEIPPATADGDVWMAYGRALPGVTDPKNHAQLAQYAEENYGETLDQRRGTLKLLQRIAELQAASA
ncbi:MAG: hypothetical protein K2Y51_26020 [Gammaproteobacteria bacterium]|nr:hypothetical protein [Gammaproteobacteria bacterium]